MRVGCVLAASRFWASRAVVEAFTILLFQNCFYDLLPNGLHVGTIPWKAVFFPIQYSAVACKLLATQ